MSDETQIATTNPQPQPTPSPAPPAPPATAAQINQPQTGNVELPHTAVVVATGTRSEREVELQAEIDALRAKVGGTEATIKTREQRINELEDENRQLKVARETPQAVKIKRSFGFFETEED